MDQILTTASNNLFTDFMNWNHVCLITSKYWMVSTLTFTDDTAVTLEVEVADEVNRLGVYADRFTSVVRSLGSSSNLTSSGINLFNGDWYKEN